MPKIDTITWHVGMSDGTVLAVTRPDRADAHPVNVWTLDGTFSQDHHWAHPDTWPGCKCQDVIREPVMHLVLVAAHERRPAVCTCGDPYDQHQLGYQCRGAMSRHGDYPCRCRRFIARVS